ncbi:cation:proton antiporter [Streptomyces cinnamoneus]|uniref:Na+/H+ antiporter n=1 Tax=Streptomyces cinnamoneus TaxID=53446 RepID=A0A918TLW3_STRCJ|nr:cation:proton antiporter [Streptomyces cinnamoneus]GHC55129.1 putative Na+/H+ antiporter [Streptomyces cinnamoneus]
MSLKTADATHVLLALVALLALAHLGGYVFKLLRQPQVIGEIAGGLVAGPTVFGQISPEAQHWLLPTTGVTASVLGAFYQIGLLLLVYLTGTELRRRGSDPERRTIGFIAVSGLALPFLFGLGVARVTDLDDLAGTNGSPTSLALVFGMAIAVTSVPVISRIMLDLGILRTAFARIVLAVAVLEDVLLYVVLAIVLGVAQAHASDAYGLWALFGTDSVPMAVVYFTAVPLLFLGLFLYGGPPVYRRVSASPLNFLAVRSPIAFRLVFVFLSCAACSGLGIDPIFGALVAGMCSADAAARDAAPARPGGASAAAAGAGEGSYDALRSIALGFFVPVYFAVVGVKLDLAHHFDPVFFLWFLLLACCAKALSVWLGARLAGEGNTSAVNLAVAMNARGGPGIVLASVAFGAHIINEDFFTSLVLLSIITSQMAGVWLGRAVRRGELPTGPSPVQQQQQQEQRQLQQQQQAVKDCGLHITGAEK